MADLFNNFPSWGETGQYPSSGFFYEGGDQVNEKHMDALWNGVKTHIDNLNTGIRDRVRDITGDVVLDQGLVASAGAATREVDVSASSAGAYVDGQKTGSTSATTLTHTANGGASTRTDVVWVNTSGTVGKTEGTTTPSNDRMKLAEVDVDPNDTITAIRNTARDHRFLIASENTPASAEPGDLWHDLTAVREKVRQGGDWRTIITEQDDITVTAGDGLKGGGSNVDLVGGASVTLNIEPADFAGDGVKDDGADNIAIEPADFAGTFLSDDGADNLTVDIGSHLENDGAGNIQVADDFVLNTGDTINGLLNAYGGINLGDSADDSDEVTFEQNGGGGYSNVNVDAINGRLRFWRQDNGNVFLQSDQANGDLKISGQFTEGAAL